MGAKSLYDTHQKGKAFDDLNLFTPQSAASDGVDTGAAHKGPFDYLNSINRATPPDSAAAAGTSSVIPKLKEQLSGLSQQESALTHQLRNGQPMERLQAQKMLPALQAQRNSLQAHFNTLTSGLQSDQDRMHSTAATALKTVGNLTPKYTSQFNDAMTRSQGGGNFFSRLWHGGREGSQREAESAAAMLEHLKQVQAQASHNIQTNLL